MTDIKQQAEEQLSMCCQPKSHIENYISYLEGRILKYEQKKESLEAMIDQGCQVLKDHLL